MGLSRGRGRFRGPGSKGSEGSKGSKGGGGGFAASFIKKGRGWRRRLCRRVVKGKVLKMDGPSAQGFLSLTGPLAPRVVDCRSAAMLIKSALREFLPALIVILSRRRRISVQGTYELIDSKYQSAGRAKYQAPA